MTVIVYGHVTRAVAWTAPIYPKQLGVALFLFATGFTLARETRPVWAALFKRLAQLWVFGFICAAAISVAGAATGTGLALSNFLPLAGGANVVFNNFPANPTTWYLGTYLHLLVVWALWLRRVRVRTWMVVAAIAIEIPLRALLMATAGRFVAYMLLTNWAAVFLYGLARGREEDVELTSSPVPWIVAAVAGFAAWAFAMRWVAFELTVPFMTLRGWPAAVALLAVSAGVSAVYFLAAAIVFESTRRLAAPAAQVVVRFIARNTSIIFLADMPVVLALHPLLMSWHVGYAGRVAIQMLVSLVGLAAVSEAIWRLLQRSSTYSTLVRARERGDGAGTATAPLMGTLR